MADKSCTGKYVNCFQLYFMNFALNLLLNMIMDLVQCLQCQCEVVHMVSNICIRDKYTQEAIYKYNILTSRVQSVYCNKTI